MRPNENVKMEVLDTAGQLAITGGGWAEVAYGGVFVLALAGGVLAAVPLGAGALALAAYLAWADI